MYRRDYIKTLIGSSTVAGISGCSALLPEPIRYDVNYIDEYSEYDYKKPNNLDSYFKKDSIMIPSNNCAVVGDLSGLDQCKMINVNFSNTTGDIYVSLEPMSTPCSINNRYNKPVPNYDIIRPDVPVRGTIIEDNHDQRNGKIMFSNTTNERITLDAEIWCYSIPELNNIRGEINNVIQRSISNDFRRSLKSLAEDICTVYTMDNRNKQFVIIDKIMSTIHTISGYDAIELNRASKYLLSIYSTIDTVSLISDSYYSACKVKQNTNDRNLFSFFVSILRIFMEIFLVFVGFVNPSISKSGSLLFGIMGYDGILMLILTAYYSVVDTINDVDKLVYNLIDNDSNWLSHYESEFDRKDLKSDFDSEKYKNEPDFSFLSFINDCPYEGNVKI